MAPARDPFSEAAIHWNLERLYKDLSAAKGKPLTPVEELRLRGLLCGYSPAEIAEKLDKDIKGVGVDLSKTIYNYVKNLVGKNSEEKIDNWRNITQWLEEAGYKNQVASEYQLNDGVSLKLLVKQANITIEKNQLILDINLRIVTPTTSESTIFQDIQVQSRETNGKE
ncbi:MAG TPA: helix-turn-helix domain containing protein [Cyanobacteria bacterium UBA11369]|nr:helix-turn-helix domain containing protein [Cyanobacteria bacterium UBA11371]HBE19188.1 helix-turn-helix domain containing protein [Cyanobacteria bacterium UBA11367]HBE34909.1 helix-turn-helix domain containing protein [Cyanobacteria bacterium UBA11368]HBE52108.1 helix-turn-helix domain containing protein [Cyanobacteria bacterium UBA11369]